MIAAIDVATCKKLFDAMMDAAFLEGWLRSEKPEIHDRAKRVADVLRDLYLEDARR